MESTLRAVKFDDAQMRLGVLSTRSARRRPVTTQRRYLLSGFSSSAVGLMGLPVHEGKDWKRLATRAIDRCQDVVKSLQNYKDMHPSKAGRDFHQYLSPIPDKHFIFFLFQIVQALDTISDTVSSVADAAELCASTHPNSSMTRAAMEAVGAVGEYIGPLNASTLLFDASCFAEERKSVCCLAF